MIVRHSVFIIAAVLATPVTVDAQTTTAFDGTYAGVSATYLGTQSAGNRASGRGCTKDVQRPGTLTITNGAGKVSWYAGPMVGSVNAQGAITMKSDWGAHLYGQIDSSGMIRARGGADCL